MSRRSLGCIFIIVALAACADDAPHWRGPGRDGKFAEKGLLTTWPETGPTLVWTVEGIGEGFSSVSVADGLIYCTGKTVDTQMGMLSAFDLSGQPKWRIDYGLEWNDMQPGTRCSPTVDSGRVYVLSALGNLICRDARTAVPIWEKDIAKTFGGEAPPCGFAESLLVDGTRLICTPGGKDASLAALDKSTGETIWTTPGLSEQSAYCSPILIERGGTRLLITNLLKSVVALEPETGRLVWQVPFDPDLILQNHSVAPAYENGLLYVTSGHRVGGIMLELAPDGRGITKKWEDETMNTLHGGLILLDGFVYGSTLKQRWACLRGTDGAVQYDERGVGMGSIAYADGMLYCYGEKGTMGLVKAAPETYELVSSFKNTAGKGPHWAHPVIAGGRLYLRHGDTLSAFDIQAR